MPLEIARFGLEVTVTPLDFIWTDVSFFIT